MIIGICLSIMLVIMLFSIVSGGEIISGTLEGIINNEIIINGSSTSMEISYDGNFIIDPVLGMIAVIIVLGALSAILGIRVLGSGLSSESIKLIMVSMMYAGLWGVLSVLTSTLIFGIETFGALIYITLTILYVFGVIQKSFGGRG